jgi:hypothetical protein
MQSRFRPKPNLVKTGLMDRKKESVPDLDLTLVERKAQYGDFTDHAGIEQPEDGRISAHSSFRSGFITSAYAAGVSDDQ